MKKIDQVKLEFNKIWLCGGLVAILIGILMPIYFKHENFKIYDSITMALEFWDKEFLIDAMFKLVLLNTIRSFPNYVAIFIIINSIAIKYRNKDNLFLKLLCVAIVIPVVYFFIRSFYNINLSVGKSSILGFIWLYCYSRFKLKGITFIKKSIGLLIFVMGIQWIDVTPYFNFLGIGELTFDLLRVADFMEASNLLNTIGILFFFLLTSFSILLLSIFKSQERDMIILEKDLENRFYKETRYLVHDLKTPLFSIHTLIEILKMQEVEEKKLLYYSKIENSLDKTNIIISEILKTNTKTPITISELFEFIFPSISPYIKDFTYENYLHMDYVINANRTLLSRAIINLITNAYEASKDRVKIILKDYKKFFYIIVEDNGPGISDEEIKKLFVEGYSTKNSTGLGLNFVNMVIKEHDFDIFFKRKNTKGTKVYIKLKGVTNYEQNFNN